MALCKKNHQVQDLYVMHVYAVPTWSAWTPLMWADVENMTCHMFYSYTLMQLC